MAKSKYPGIKLLNEIGTKKDIAAAYGVSERTIYRWQNKAKAESGERQQYPGAKAISKFKGTRKELAKKYNVSERTAYRWVNKAKAQGAPIESRRQKSKYPGTAILEEEGTNRTIADRYNVSKSTIQRWKQKAQKELSFEMPEEIITPEAEDNNLDIDKNIKADFEQDETEEDFEDETKEDFGEPEFDDFTDEDFKSKKDKDTNELLRDLLFDNDQIRSDSIFRRYDDSKQKELLQAYIDYQFDLNPNQFYNKDIHDFDFTPEFTSTINMWGDEFETWLKRLEGLTDFEDDWLNDL